MSVCFTMHGIGVSEGIAIGQAHLFAGMSAEANHYEIAPGDVAREQRRYDRAVKDVFVHITAVERSNIGTLDEGMRVSFETEPDKRGKGPKAVNLQLAS